MSDRMLPDLPSLPQVPSGVDIRHISGWPGYAVSSEGQVFSCRKIGNRGYSLFATTWHLLHPTLRGRPEKKYRWVMLSRCGKAHNRKVHILVLEAFVGPRPPGYEGCHNDGNQLNDIRSNLRWDTPLNNQHDRYSHGTITFGERHPRARFTNDDIVQMRQLAKEGMPQVRIADVFHTSFKTVSKIVRRERWPHIP